jgi:hypothetical protein
MMVGLHTFPPLGRVSQIKSQAVSFSLILEVAKNDIEKPWEVCIWHSSGEQPWEETILSSAPTTHCPNFLQPGTLDCHHLFFSATRPLKTSLRFTFKYRSSPAEPWTWARDQLGVNDGLILKNAEGQHLLTDDLSNIIQGLNPELKVTSVASQTPRTRLWTIEAPVAAAGEDESAFADVELGTPWGGFLR